MKHHKKKKKKPLTSGEKARKMIASWPEWKQKYAMWAIQEILNEESKTKER